MADRDTDTPPDPLVQVAELEQRLRELDEEERELRERLAEIRRRAAAQRASSGPPSSDGAAPWKWAVCMYVVGFIVAFLFHQVAR
jgi:hypothetical protein